MRKKQFDAIFVCTTPLQIMISSKIIESERLSNVIYIILYYQRNEKYNFYIDKLLKDSFRVIEYEIKSKSKATRLIELFKYISFIKKHNATFGKFRKLYVASIDNIFIHTTLSILAPTEVYTYDDGLANLNKQGTYYIEHSGIFQRIIKIIMGISWDINSIKSTSKKHYSIFPNKTNIIDNIKYIPLNNAANRASVDKGVKTEVMNIFIGQPLTEIDSYFSKEYIELVLDRLNITHYLPHPRETTHFDSVKYISTPMILEDYYAEIYNNHVAFYTFFSTSIINIKNINPEQQSYVIYDDYLMRRYKHLYSIFIREEFSLIKLREHND